MDAEPPNCSSEPNHRPPAYYNSLAPFRELFGRGNPVLTYHKLGPRPRRVRLKGLYLRTGLFRQQLGELKAAGFTSGFLSKCAGPLQPRRIVLTFDDGYVNVLRHAAAPLAAAGLKAIQFLPANLLGRCNEWDVPLGEASEAIMDAAQVREWLAAGHDIGSHTLTHPLLTRLRVDEAREEISASKKKLEDIFSRAVDYFCYPYGDWNESVRELVIEAGYRAACTTDFGVNDAGTSPFALKRITARYRTRNWETLKTWLTERRTMLTR